MTGSANPSSLIDLASLFNSSPDIDLGLAGSGSNESISTYSTVNSPPCASGGTRDSCESDKRLLLDMDLRHPALQFEVGNGRLPSKERAPQAFAPIVKETCTVTLSVPPQDTAVREVQTSRIHLDGLATRRWFRIGRPGPVRVRLELRSQDHRTWTCAPW